MAANASQIDPQDPYLAKVVAPGWTEGGVYVDLSAGTVSLVNKDGTPALSNFNRAASAVSVGTRMQRMAGRTDVNTISVGATVVTYGFTFNVPQRCSDVQFVFTNSYIDGSNIDQPVGNAFAIEASIYTTVNSTSLIPLTFNGALSYSFPATGVIVDQPTDLGLDLAPGVYFGRVVLTVALTTDFIPVGGVKQEYIPGDGRTAASNLVRSATALGSAGGGASLYAPIAIVGKVPNSTGVSLIVVGDSIPEGTGDASATSGGYVLRGLSTDPTQNLFRDLGVYSTTFMPKGGTSLSGWTDRFQTLQRFPMLKYGDVMLVDLGTNDLGAALGQMPIRALALWRRLQAFGKPMIATTVTPVTTGTFATPAAQTVTANEPKRLEYNAWIRDGAPISLDGLTPQPTGTATSLAIRIGATAHPIAKMWDKAILAEVDDNGTVSTTAGKWRGLWTADGTHPSTTGAIGIAPVVDKAYLLRAAKGNA